MQKSKWFGIKTKLNKITVEKYVSPQQIINAEKNKLNDIIVGPFEALSESEATELVKGAVGK